MKKPTTILGVDPGTNFMGYAVLKKSGNDLVCITLGEIRMGKFNTHQEKLKHIFDRIQGITKAYPIDHMAIEAPFFGKNVQSMLKLGRAQGVAIAAAMTAGVSVSEYSPKAIKLAITGNGNASKEQVLGMLKQLVKFKVEAKTLDASDALGAAVCHQFKSESAFDFSKEYKDWSSFLKDNPNRVLKK